MRKIIQIAFNLALLLTTCIGVSQTNLDQIQLTGYVIDGGNFYKADEGAEKAPKVEFKF